MAGGYNKTGVLQAVLARFTRIDMLGAPIVGPKNSFWSDSLISIDYSFAYSKQDEISITNGAGIVCTTYSPPQTLLRLDVNDIAFCYPDPEAIEFLAGGVVFHDAVTPNPNAIGYAAPPVGRDPKPNGVAIELWASQIYEGSVVGYVHWLLPRVKLQFTKGQQLNGTDPFQVGLDGIANQNSAWGDGPSGAFEDWAITERCYQWVQESALPDYSYGYAAVAA